MTSQPGKQIIVIHILPNISRSIDNHTLKFGPLIEYNMKNIFLEKLYTKCGGETIPTPFSKISKLSYLWINSLKFIQFDFIVCQVEAYQNILKLNWRLIAFTSYKASSNSKRRSGTSLSARLFA